MNEIVIYAVGLAAFGAVCYWVGRTAGRFESEAATHELSQAIRLTAEYLGPGILPMIPGWSWWDALKAHAPGAAAHLARHWSGIACRTHGGYYQPDIGECTQADHRTGCRFGD